MASVVEICNLALLRIGQSEIQALNESSVEAGYCRAFYDRCRKSTLRAHPWNFALAVASLAALTTTSREYAGVYQLPADCIRALSLLGGTPDAPIIYQIKGKTLETDMSSPVLKYTKDVTDPNQFDESFVDALAWRLASELALPVTGKADLTQVARQSYIMSVREARAMDMNEGHKPAETNQSFVDARA